MNFQKYALIFFIILLLIILIFLGVTMSKNNENNIAWPPIIGNCPDYWLDTPEEAPEEFIELCTNNNSCTMIPNPDNEGYDTYINVYDKNTNTYEENLTIGTFVSTDNKMVDSNNNILTCIIDNDTNTQKCGSLVPNPNYGLEYPAPPYIPGSRCIGTVGMNSGSIEFDSNNSTFSPDQEKKDITTCATCKTKTIDFTDTGLNYTGSTGLCQKQQWAKSYGLLNSDNIKIPISWDGITYGFGENDPCS